MRIARAFLCLTLISAFLGASATQTPTDTPFILILGIAQDGGYPQTGCMKDCCAAAWQDPAQRRNVASIAIVDPQTRERWIIDATPDFREQLRLLDDVAPSADRPGLAGILLTHAHMGHYTGLMHLGHEAIGAKGVPVYAMPRMAAFLREHGPWDQLVRYDNIKLRMLEADEPVKLNERLTVTPLRVPHREEYSEVVGFRIDGPKRSALYVPDIDKWERWERRIEDLIAAVDVAYLDGTFFANGEILNRDMAEIPHPFVVESMQRFAPLAAEQRERIRFIHLNHTNPAMREDGTARRRIEAAGMGVADQGERFGL